MSVHNRRGPDLDVDLDATDELPALNLAEVADAQANTDVYANPVIPAGMSDLADSLRDVESRLQRKIERVQKVEAELQLAVSTRQQVEERLRQQEQSAATTQSALRDELEQALRHSTELAGQHAATQAELASVRDIVQEQRVALAAAQQQLAQLGNERSHQERDLGDWRRRAERAFEALTSWQGFRGVADGMLGESEAALTEARSRLSTETAALQSRLTNETAALQSRLTNETSALQSRHDSELAALKSGSARELEALKASTAAELAALRTSSAAELAALKSGSANELEALKKSSAAELAALQSSSAAELAALKSNHATELAALQSSSAAEVAVVHARETALEKDLAAAREQAAQRIAMLEESLARADKAAEVQAESLRIHGERTGTLSTQLAARDASLAEAQTELEALRAVEEKARQGAAVFDAQNQQIAAVQAERDTAQDRIQELSQQLRQATERVERLESEAHASAALLGNLQQNIDRLGREDTGSRPTLKESLFDNVVRVLIRQEGGADVVYPVSRRTTIGRTPENDIQIDTTFVSRHHAVLLSSPDACIVEDLNSTNGVLVNGRRVGRQVLQDGDTLTVGKTEFRYQQRS